MKLQKFLKKKIKIIKKEDIKEENNNNNTTDDYNNFKIKDSKENTLNSINEKLITFFDKVEYIKIKII